MVTCEDGRSVLLTSSECGCPTEGRGGVAVSCGCWGRSARVAGVARKLWSQPEGNLLLRGQRMDFGSLCEILLSSGLSGSLCCSLSLSGLVEGSGRWRRGPWRRGDAMLAWEKKGRLCCGGRNGLLLLCCGIGSG